MPSLNEVTEDCGQLIVGVENAPLNQLFKDADNQCRLGQGTVQITLAPGPKNLLRFA